MTQLCHYTDDEGAEKIIRSGKILASLKSSRDAASGNGVYLTKLNPNNPGSLTRAQMAQNNWLSKSKNALKKTKNVFVLEIPDNKVKNFSTETRNIFKFGGRKDLPLVKYKWYLQDFDTGTILASHKYHIGSTGPASANFFTMGLMGDYVMTEKTVNGRPVYKKSWYNSFLLTNSFLFMSSNGGWFVGPYTDKDAGWLSQKDKYSLGPGAAGEWDYVVYDADRKGCFKGDDATLKAYPWYKCSPWKTIQHSDSRIDPVSAATASATATTSNTPATPAASTALTTATSANSPGTSSATTASTTATSPVITTATPGTASISVKALVHTAPASIPAITTPAPATNPTTPSVLSSSWPTSSNMADPDNDKELQSSGTTPSGRVYGAPPGKAAGLTSRLAMMLFWFALVMVFVFGFCYYRF